MRSPSLRAEPLSGRVRRARPLLGTLVEIEVDAQATEQTLHAGVDAAFAVIERIHQLMSYQDPDSEISKINGAGTDSPQRVGALTLEVLRAALEFARLSEGAFDPCIGQPGSWRDVDCSAGGWVRFHSPLRVDLSGIAKGFAVDQAMAALAGFGFDRAMVNAGGDLRVAGDEPWPVHLRHPVDPSRVGHSLSLRNAALATSAPYFSRALIDKRLGEPYAGDRSVSVSAKSCMTADALTKVVLFADPAIAARCLEQFDAVAYML
jgi:FAD:protein FMN transferase